MTIILISLSLIVIVGNLHYRLAKAKEHHKDDLFLTFLFVELIWICCLLISSSSLCFVILILLILIDSILFGTGVKSIVKFQIGCIIIFTALLVILNETYIHFDLYRFVLNL